MVLRFLAFLSLALCLIGCAERRSESGLKVLHFGNGDEPQDLDPQVVSGAIEHKLFLALFEGLVAQNPLTDEPEPGVAKSWTVSPDGLIYTFQLRDNARWSNGDGVTAGDFVRSYQRILTPSLASDYAYMLYVLEGAQAFNQGKLDDFTKVGVRALDTYTLELRLRQPTPFLLKALQHYAWYPVHIPTIEKFDALGRRGTAWTRLENFVGNGPFTLKEWRPGQKIVVERAAGYWDRDQVKLDQIHFYPISSTDVEERLFRTGQLDVTYQVPASKLDVYRRERPGVLRIDPWYGTYFYRFNIQKKPLDDVRVRRALALAVDRQSLVQNVTLAGEMPAFSVIPQEVAGYRSSAALVEDVAEARRLLAEAGFPEGRGFPRLEININILDRHQVIAEAIQQMWKRNLGIEVGIVNQEWRVYMATQNAISFDIQRGGWIADYMDPHVFMDMWITGGGNNHTHWAKPEYDELLGSALGAPSQEARYDIYRRMEGILLADMPVMPLFYYVHSRLVDEKVLHYRTTPMDDFPWKHVDLKP